MDLSSLSKETLISIIQDQHKVINGQQVTESNTLTQQRPVNFSDYSAPCVSIPPTPPTPPTPGKKRLLYSYNLTDGDGFNKDKLLDDHNVIYIGVDDEYTSKHGGFAKYFDSIKGATHVITYKSKTHFGHKGGIFKDIYKLSEPTVITDIETFREKSKLVPGFGGADGPWMDYGPEAWIGIEGNYCILWTTKLVTSITLPFDGSGIRIRTRFGYIKPTHDLYHKI